MGFCGGDKITVPIHEVERWFLSDGESSERARAGIEGARVIGRVRQDEKQPTSRGPHDDDDARRSVELRS